MVCFGNRDTNKFPDPNQLVIDRSDVRQHLSFGFGIIDVLVIDLRNCN